MTEGLWTVKETAAYLRLSTSWIYKRVCANDFPHVKIGSVVRFVPEQVRQYAAAAMKASEPTGARVIPLRGRGR
jgi:excisionase family DNA binding protein